MAETPVSPTTPASGLRSLPRNVWVLTAVSFLTDVSTEMTLNLIPLFLASVLGVKTGIIGLIEGVAETTASFTKLYSGVLSDRWGSRKGLTVLGYGLSTISKPFLYFATTWERVLGVRFFDRMGKGIRTAPRDALMAGSVQEKQRGLAFGLHRAGDTAGAFIGLAIAALVIWQTQAGVAQITRSTFQLIVVISFFPALLAVLVLTFGAKEVPGGKKTSAPVFSLQGLDRRFRFFLLSLILFTLGNSSDAFITLRAQNVGLTVLQIMGVLLTFNLVYTVFAGPLGALSDRVGRRKLMLGGWMLYGLIYLGLALAQTGWQIWLLYGLYGLFYAATEGAAKALVADLVPDERRGAAYGLYNGALGLMALPASIIAGLLWQGLGAWAGLGPSAPFYFGALMALSAGILFLEDGSLTMKLTLRARGPFNFRAAIGSHGWYQLSPFTFDEASGVLTYVLRLDTGRVVELRLFSKDGGLSVQTEAELTARERDVVREAVSWMFALDSDLAAFYAAVRSEPKLSHVESAGGGRVLRSPSFFEDVLKTILTTNTLWAATKRMNNALIAQFGEPLSADGARRAFPAPARLAASSEAELRAQTRLGYRAPYVLDLAQRTASGELDLEAFKTSALPTAELRKELMKIKGIGPYAAANLLVLLGRSDFIPIDSWAMKMVSHEWHKGEPVTSQDVEAAFAKWGEWKGLAYFFWDYDFKG